MRKQEAAGAVRVLGVTGLPARLAEERRLLIARDSGNRNGSAKHRRIGVLYNS